MAGRHKSEVKPRCYLETDIDEVMAQTTGTVNDEMDTEGTMTAKTRQQHPEKNEHGKFDIEETVPAKTVELAQEHDPMITTNEPLWSEFDLEESRHNGKGGNVWGGPPALEGRDEQHRCHDSTELSKEAVTLKTKVAMVFCFPLGWWAYRKEKEVRDERTRDAKPTRDKLELVDVISTLAIGLGVGCAFMLIFLLSLSLYSYHWQPSTLKSMCRDIEDNGFTSRVCKHTS